MILVVSLVFLILFPGKVLGSEIEIVGEGEASGWVGDLEFKMMLVVTNESRWDEFKLIFKLKNHGEETYSRAIGRGTFYAKVFTKNNKVIRRLKWHVVTDEIIYLELEQGEGYSETYNGMGYRILKSGVCYISGVWCPRSRELPPDETPEIETSKIKIKTKYVLRLPLTS
jgi:hypothetical protein